MAAGTRISLEQYFRTPTDGECELLDGELRPKPMGTLDRSRVQARLRDALRPYEEAGRGEAIAEMSLRMGETVLIPDFLFSQPDQQTDVNRVFDTPPQLCIESISPSQSFSEIYTKCLRYLRWGVAHCWIIDPIRRLAWQMDASELPREILPADSLRAAGIEVKLADLYK
jgi:Uma2 family endonuclease